MLLITVGEAISGIASNIIQPAETVFGGEELLVLCLCWRMRRMWWGGRGGGGLYGS